MAFSALLISVRPLEEPLPPRWDEAGIEAAIRDLTQRGPTLVHVLNDHEALVVCRKPADARHVAGILEDADEWFSTPARVGVVPIDQDEVDTLLHTASRTSPRRKSQLPLIASVESVDSDHEVEVEFVQSDDEAVAADDDDDETELKTLEERRRELKAEGVALNRYKEKLAEEKRREIEEFKAQVRRDAMEEQKKNLDAAKREIQRQQQQEMDRLKKEMEEKAKKEAAAEQARRLEHERREAEEAIRETREKERRLRQARLEEIQRAHQKEIRILQETHEAALQEQRQSAQGVIQNDAVGERLCQTLDALKDGLIQQSTQIRQMQSGHSSMDSRRSTDEESPEDSKIKFKPPTITPLTGKETPAEYRDWRRTVKWLKTCYTDRMIQQGIVTALRGEAARRVGAPRSGTTADDIIRTLDCSYLVDRTAQQFRTQMDSYRQGSKELTSAYIATMVAIWEEAAQEFPDRFPEHRREEDLRECIVHGMQPEMKAQMRWKIADKSCTVAEFTREVKIIEAENEAAKLNAKAQVKATEVKVKQATAVQPASKIANPIELELKKINERFEELTKRREARGQRPNSFRINETTQEKEYRCYNCDNFGHMARECDQPKRPRRSQPASTPAASTTGNAPETGTTAAASTSR